MRIATCQYQIDKPADWQAYQHKIEKLVKKASELKADLLLFPEYVGTEMVQAPTDEELYSNLQPLIPKYLAFYQQLAQQFQLYIQPGTIIEAESNKYRNRAYLFTPNGKYDYQDKLQLTEFEKQQQVLQGGIEQKVFVTTFGKIAIAICYDIEFPELIKPLIQAGAWLLLVPSYTSAAAGNNRVRVSCRARALENQCYVARSSIVGKVYTGETSENTVGQAGIYGPMDNGFPDDGIIKEGSLNQLEMIIADVFPEKLALAREQGQVHNLSDSKNCIVSEKTILSLLSKA